MVHNNVVNSDWLVGKTIKNADTGTCLT